MLCKIGHQHGIKGIFAGCAQRQADQGDAQLRSGDQPVARGFIFQPLADQLRAQAVMACQQIQARAA